MDIDSIEYRVTKITKNNKKVTSSLIIAAIACALQYATSKYDLGGLTNYVRIGSSIGIVYGLGRLFASKVRLHDNIEELSQIIDKNKTL